ncbi:hypothetical protein EDD55_103294 [Varunaivibrio sulfuroxidans]|uniref:Uncharacterized protein n=1 Tax=Varunaivibrio sulfuroxidans TaxID=1773489 RepID=A0A4R3JG37_9PROT|nr:hypothetical protein EDD55_103294 [Varunaivibrio sulfuroxidans]
MFLLSFRRANADDIQRVARRGDIIRDWVKK